MNPAAHHLVARHSLGLRDLSLVVRKHVVGPTGVDVEPIAQQRHRHRRALDMPARESRTPRAGPHLETVLARRLPQREVPRVSLARIDLAARPRQKLISRVPRQPAVSRKARDVEVDSAADLIRVAALDELRDDLDHLRDVRGGPRILARGPGVDHARVVHERLGVVVGDLLRRLLLEARRDEHLVLPAVEAVVGEVADVSDVHHLVRVVAEVLEGSREHIGEHVRAQVADVREAIHGRAAGVDAHAAGFERTQLLLAPGHRVVEADAGTRAARQAPQG